MFCKTQQRTTEDYIFRIPVNAMQKNVRVIQSDRKNQLNDPPIKVNMEWYTMAPKQNKVENKTMI